MGLFGKKKDPLDNLGLPKEESTEMPHIEEPQFEHQTPPSTDPLSSVPPMHTEAPQTTDPYQQYQQAVNSQPESFHTTEQNTHDLNTESKTSGSHSEELILSKLDVIKAMIETLGHRIENLEQKYQYEKELKKKSSW